MSIDAVDQNLLEDRAVISSRNRGSEMLRVIIASGRDFQDYALLAKTADACLSDAGGDVCVVCGESDGVRSLSGRYAEERGYALQNFPADQERHGSVAGYVQNTLMARNADALIAFWDGRSPDIQHMVATAKHLGLSVHVSKYIKPENY